VEQPRK